MDLAGEERRVGASVDWLLRVAIDSETNGNYAIVKPSAERNSIIAQAW
jgi:hypothetical protein